MGRDITAQVCDSSFVINGDPAQAEPAILERRHSPGGHLSNYRMNVFCFSNQVPITAVSTGTAELQPNVNLT